MVSHSMTQVGKWSRRLVGSALVLAFAGLAAPATTSAAGRIRGHEVIVIEDEAPWTPQTDGYIEPVPSIPSNSGVDSEGGSDSGGGLLDGGGYVPSGPSGDGTSGRPELVSVEEAMESCTFVIDHFNDEGLPDGYFDHKVTCNLALAVFDCEDQWSGTYSEVEEIELDDNENVENTRTLGRCDIVNPYGGWLQLWYDPYDPNGSEEPIEICSGGPGRPGECWEP